MQPLKAIHIVKSYQPTQTPKLAKEYVFPYSDKGGRKKSTCGNSVYVAIAGLVVNRRSVLLRNFVLNGQISASNPLLRLYLTISGNFKTIHTAY